MTTITLKPRHKKAILAAFNDRQQLVYEHHYEQLAALQELLEMANIKIVPEWKSATNWKERHREYLKAKRNK